MSPIFISPHDIKIEILQITLALKGFSIDANFNISRLDFLKFVQLNKLTLNGFDVSTFYDENVWQHK